MRTTLTIDPDVAERLRRLQWERRWSFAQAVNHTLRRGLASGSAVSSAPYRMPVLDLKLKAGVDIDLIRDVLADEDDRRLIGT